MSRGLFLVKHIRALVSNSCRFKVGVPVALANTSSRSAASRLRRLQCTPLSISFVGCVKFCLVAAFFDAEIST